MDATLLLKALIALAPVLLLLFVFDRLDVFNLIPMRTIGGLLATGSALAALSFLANWRVMDGFPIGFSAYSRFVAPLIEETLKAAPIIAMFALNRVGFKLDATIAGFAVGAGFSVVENLWYLAMLSDANTSAWIVRGFGTAIMHGGATALFAVIGHELTEKQAANTDADYQFKPWLFLPGLAAAYLVHSGFNQFASQPVLVMAATLLLIPVTLFLTLSRSERVTQNWLKSDEAAHRQMLELLRDGNFSTTPLGAAIQSILAKLPPALADDALAYAQLKLELVLRAEASILASQTGAPQAQTPEERDLFARHDALVERLGKTVTSALNARLGLTRNDIWEIGRLRARLSI